MELGSRHGIDDVRRRRRMVRSYLLSSKYKVNRIDDTAIGSVKEKIETLNIAIDKPGHIQSRFHSVKIGASDQDIDIPRIADGCLLDSANPLCNSISTNDCIRHTGMPESRRNASQSIPD